MPRKRFDFSPVLKALYEIEDSSFIDKRTLALSRTKAIFQHEALCRYTALCLQGDFRSIYKKSVDDHLPPTGEENPKMGLSGRYTDYAPQTTLLPGNMRLGDKYMLTQGETAQAVDMFEQAPILQQTVAALQAVLVSYCERLKTAHNRYPNNSGGLGVRIGSAIDGALSFSGNFSMMHDLMPVIALSVSRDGWDGQGELTEGHFHRGLTLAFQKKAFRTAMVDIEAEEMIETRCPFSPVLANWMAAVPVMDADGNVRIDSDDKLPGALPAFVASRIQFYSKAYVPELPQNTL